MLKNPEIMAKAVAETDRVLGANVATAPTYSQVVQLTYITQILKEALRLWPPAPAFSLAPLKDEVIGGQYKLKKARLHQHPRAVAASRSRRVGSACRGVRSRELHGGSRGQAPGQCVEAVRQRSACLHRARVRDARSGFGARPHPAALHACRSPALSAEDQGNADDQARRVQDQGAHARGSRTYAGSGLVFQTARARHMLAPRRHAPRSGRRTERSCSFCSGPISARRRNSRIVSPRRPK